MMKLPSFKSSNPPPGGITMLPEIEQFQKWLRRKAPHASTPKHYGNDLELFFTWLHKGKDEVRVVDIDSYIEHCQQVGLALTTINRRLAALRSFYNFLALESNTAPRNPVIPNRHFIRIGQSLPRDIQDPLVEKLFSVITGPRDRAMFLLMLRCGLRVGEVRNLSLNDLYLEPALGSLPRLWLHGKGGRQRVVYLSAQPLAALQVWLKIRMLTQDKAVFLNRFGRRLSVTAIQKRLGVYCRQAGIWVTCHQLRHTFGRHMTEARVPVTTIQKLLGHARLKTTEVYMHISDSQVQEDYQTAIMQISRILPLESRIP
jgi:site-specific recombinase XerD